MFHGIHRHAVHGVKIKKFAKKPKKPAERICLSAGFFEGSFSTQISTDSPDFRSAGRRAR